MNASAKHVLEQGPTIRALVRVIAAGAMQQAGIGGKKRTAVEAPGPEYRATLPPRSTSLIRDYLENVGGNALSYGNTVPPHLFPQWTFGLAAKTLEGIPYPLAKVLNGGCRLEVHAPLPAGEALEVTACLEDVDDNGRRAVMHQKLVTGTKSAPGAVVAHLYAIVPLKRKSGDAGGEKKKDEKPKVPVDARELARFSAGPRAGLDFAILTGDFNPVHWIPPYAKAFGFKNTILHGFATMARTIEIVNREMLGGDPAVLASIDVKFTKPLVLPKEVGVFADASDCVYVGDAPGTDAYLTGQIVRRGA